MVLPRISIIIPVYNVEKYIEQCLDSVINQTMQDIQVICVNDGTLDNSRTILQKYADEDARIEIVDKYNGGLSSARNTAFPYIKGKYTMFVDSDDWIELDLSEKAYKRAEENDASITIFFYKHEYKPKNVVWDAMYGDVSYDDKFIVGNKFSLFDYPTAWSKLWLSDFLIGNEIYFPEDLVFEDLSNHWKAVILAQKIVVLPDQLYHYRYHTESICGRIGTHYYDIIKVFDTIFSFLHESGNYHIYKEKYHWQKLVQIYIWYGRISNIYKQEFKELIRSNLTKEDKEFYLESNSVEDYLFQFYKVEIGGR